MLYKLNTNVGMRFMDELQGVAIARDLLLRSVPRLGLMHDQLPHAARRRHDALDAVRRLGGFDLGVRALRVQLLGILAEKEVLAPGASPSRWMAARSAAPKLSRAR